MHMTAFVCAFVLSTQTISLPGDEPVAPLPQRQSPGQMQERRQRPQTRQMATQITNRRGTGVLLSVSVHHDHVPHQFVAVQTGKSFVDVRVVKGEKRESSRSIPTSEPLDLPPTETALAVVNHNVGFRPLLRSGQDHRSFCLFGHQVFSETAGSESRFDVRCGSYGV